MLSYEQKRRQRILTQAEGYFELGMHRHALEILSGWGPTDSLSDHALYLQGECLRGLECFREALEPLKRAAHGTPDNIDVWLALGWCYKRCGRLDLAIESLEEALTVAPDEALIHYNLACYWSLANNKRQALAYLARAFDLQDDYRSLVAKESDFDPIRSDPSFQALVRVVV